ncbi:hypothetical protein L596_001066 [Steinernema carpocapsae]|uniref:Uncharacterized protein n=1 Tax=Steinernema carpocapsae TaxID=34508 RepID=A0A4U8UMI4_STECR|nr:hypothetical protein L596_001066 [Steinernema carpocapsae]
MDAEEPEELVLISPFEVKQEPVEPDDPRHPDYSPASDANEADDTNQDHDNHIQQDASDEDCIEQFDIQGLRLAEFTGVTVHRRDLYIGTRFHNYGQVKFLSADDLCRHFPEALFSFLSAFADAPLEMEVLPPASQVAEERSRTENNSTNPPRRRSGSGMQTRYKSA